MTRFDIGGGVRARVALFVVAAVAVTACGGDSTTGPPGGGGTTEQWVTASTRSWSLPGQAESYECHSELATADTYYTGFRLASPPAAQAELYLSVRSSVAQIGDFDCDNPTLLGGELIYAAGPGTTPVTFTGGKGVHVAAGQYTLLVEHLNNTSASPVTATTTIEGRVAAAKDVTTPIDMFFVGRLQFPLPADTNMNVVNGGCGTVTDFNLVAEIPIIRSLGVHQTFTVTDPQHVAHPIFDSSFDPKHVLFTSLSTDFLVVAGSRVSASCTYVNTTGVVVNFGESANEESCLFGLYRYPPRPATSVSPFECPMGYEI